MAIGAATIDGLMSGLDTTSIISSLAAIQSRPLTLVQNRLAQRSADIQSYQALTAKVLMLNQSAGALAGGTTLNAREAVVSDAEAITASAGTGAAVGSYQLTVKQLAQSHKISSGTVADSGAALGMAGDVSVNGHVISLGANDDLGDLRDKLNQAQAGVSASIVSVSASDHRLVLRSTTTGSEGAIDLKEVSSGAFQSVGLLDGQEVAHELQAAQDAQLDLDGYAITRSSNSIDDLLEGVSLDLHQADENQTITLTVNRSTDAALSAMQQVVSDYNSVIDALNTGQQYDSASESGGVFFGDLSILTLQDSLHDSAMASVSALGGDLTVMSQIGLSTDQYGHLTLNASQFQEALDEDPEGVGRLLGVQAQTTNDEVTYVSSETGTADSGSGGYAVEITQVATKAQAQSAPLSTGLTQDETLTLNGQYSVSLTAGMTLQQAADKLNQVLEGNKLSLAASVVDDHLQLQSSLYGSNYGFSVTSTVADGAGGTDLGGATSGATQAYYGQNVAGTIGEHKAEGWGQYLTGSEDVVNGLKVQITSATTGSKGVVKVSEGFASRLASYSSRAIDADNGLLTRATTAVSDQITSLAQDADKMSASVKEYTEQLQLKFATMEGVVAKNKSLLSYLTSQIASLQGLSVDQNA